MTEIPNSASPLPDFPDSAISTDKASRPVPPSKPPLPQPPLPQPPLSISHLMLWTLGSAIILSANRTLFQQEMPTESLRVVEVVRSIVMSILYGINLAALLVFLSRAIRWNGPLPREPGHWLLFNGGIAAIVSFLLYALFLWNRGGDWNITDRKLGLYYFIVYGIQFCLWLAAIVGLAGRRALLWQLLFAYQIVICGIAAAIGAWMLWESTGDSLGMSLGGPGFGWFLWWSQIQPWVEYVPTCVGICGLALWEFCRRERRDWLHYAGVTTEAAMLLLYVGLHLAHRFLLRLN